MEILLIRHGETKGNREHRYIGKTDEPLTPEALTFFSENRDRYPAVQFVVTSSLRRCRESAQALFPDIPVEMCSDLNECDFGAFENKNHEEMNGDPAYQAWIDSGGTLPFPDGESREAFQERGCNSFLAFAEKARKQGIGSMAFVVHGGTVMSVLNRFSFPHKSYYEWQTGCGTGFLCSYEIHDGEPYLSVKETLPGKNKTGVEDLYVMKDLKRLRCGVTTGSCAAAAAGAAVRMLLLQQPVTRMTLQTPAGVTLQLPVEDAGFSKTSAFCSVVKDAGDDPDVTDGAKVCAAASFIPVPEAADRASGRTEADSTELHESRQVENTAFSGKYFVYTDSAGFTIHLDAGSGIGRVTNPGLEQDPGYPALNRIPRQMIFRTAGSVCRACSFRGDLYLTLSVPGGKELAERTFNPSLGIEGGISILGTTGIVVPMSEQALIESIRIEMKQKIAAGNGHLLVTPGNMGKEFAGKISMLDGVDTENCLKCSNFVGETLDAAVLLGAKSVLFASHIGKFIKVSGGIMNTHSREADCRAELFAAHALSAGVPAEVCRQLLGINTTEEGVLLLRQEGFLKAVTDTILSRIQYYLQRRCGGRIRTGIILYSSKEGFLGCTDNAPELADLIRKGE